MTLRRAAARRAGQEWIAAAHGLIVFAALSAGAALPAAAAPRPSDELPQALLEDCEARAAPFGQYRPAIAGAANDLIAMGVFAETDFHGVKAGFCGLRANGGPAATLSCARDTVLLDSGYDGEDKSLVLKATLAHEMKHHLQHKDKKAAFGEAYCFSERYATDKAEMEREADAFGDAVAALFFTGRSVEIRNDCPVPASIYVEADKPLSAPADALRFIEAPPHSTIAAPVRATSMAFRYYAQTDPHDGRIWTWGEPSMADKRFIEGDIYGLRPVSLPAASPSSGPFRLILSCTEN